MQIGKGSIWVRQLGPRISGVKLIWCACWQSIHLIQKASNISNPMASAKATGNARAVGQLYLYVYAFLGCLGLLVALFARPNPRAAFRRWPGWLLSNRGFRLGGLFW